MAQVPPPALVEAAARNDLPSAYDDRDLKEKQSIDAESADVVGADAYFDPRSQSWCAICRQPDANNFGLSADPDDVYPTEEEAATLKRVPDRVPFSSYLVAVVELGERFSYYGTTGEYLRCIGTRWSSLTLLSITQSFSQYVLP